MACFMERQRDHYRTAQWNFLGPFFHLEIDAVFLFTYTPWDLI